MDIFESFENTKRFSEKSNKVFRPQHLDPLDLQELDIYSKNLSSTTQNELLCEIVENTRELASQTEELHRVANAAEEHAKIAEKEATEAIRTAKESKRQSRKNMAIAILAILVALLAWLVPRETVLQAIYSFSQLR